MTTSEQSVVQVDGESHTSDDWGQAQSSASSQSVLPAQEVERYIAVACSLALIILLILGAAGYAGVRRLLSFNPKAASVSHVEDGNRKAAPDSLIAPTSPVAPSLIAAHSVVDAASPS